ncbi:MAG: U32 family peptidase [Syntrophomonadaceae bacterium]|jgi:putative protease|nr:U32 family peptidase [Syntrophomonadaceae bacterium]MDH7497971.1 U32 family peptidase [Syntrophomonadaceae bacterium]
MVQPELVAPAGTLEKAEAAFAFGADAVYLGGTEFSLRAAAGNLDAHDLGEAVALAHGLGKRVYVTVNALAHTRDLQRLPAFLESLAALRVDSIIVADLGVMALARRYAPEVPITVSTQASVTNAEAARVYRELGARRVVLAREATLEDIADIAAGAGVEVEVFVHGAMCIAYSGRCLLSSAMTGRSGNRGECAHPCRYRYALVEEQRPGEYYPLEEDGRGSYLLNSRDLCLLDRLEALSNAGVRALKIEGRMKSLHYVATVTRVYRQALDALAAGQTTSRRNEWWEELHKVATRPFTEGFLWGTPAQGQDLRKEEKRLPVAFAGIVRDYDGERGLALVEQRGNFGVGDLLELLPPGEAALTRLRLRELYDMDLRPLPRARHAQQLVWAPLPGPLPPFTLVRRVVEAHG